jgi:O-antigen ligase
LTLASVKRCGGLKKLSSMLLFASVAAAPLPFGSTDPSVIAIWCVVLGVALAASPAGDLRPIRLIPLALVGVIVIGYAIVLHEQLAAHPWSGAAPNPIWSKASGLLDADLAPSVAVVRTQPFLALGAPLAALLAFTTSYIVCADRERARQLLRVVAWSGVVYAVLGTAFFVLDPTQLLWREKTAYLESLTGPFVNRNTAAVYFGSCACVCLLLLLQELRSLRRSGKEPLRMLAITIDRSSQLRLVRAAAFVFISIAALLATGSRAGVVCSLVGLVIAFTGFRWRDLSRRGGLMLALLIGAAVAVALLQIFGGSVGARFEESGLTDEARLETYRSTLHMIADHPWLGSGLGSFAWAFPPYRESVSIWGTWNRAHDTMLEIAAEAGIPLAAMIAVAWILVIVVLLRGMRKRRRGLIFPVAAICVTAISLLHALVDFSLQIPGFAIMVFSLVGAGVAQSYRTRQPAEG